MSNTEPKKREREREQESPETRDENIERWEHDLPRTTNDERHERNRREMEEKYGYDINK